MIVLMLVGVGVVAAVLLYVVHHKRPVVNNVGLADPASWHVQPTLPTPPPDEVMMPPPAPHAHGDHHAQL